MILTWLIYKLIYSNTVVKLLNFLVFGHTLLCTTFHVMHLFLSLSSFLLELSPILLIDMMYDYLCSPFICLFSISSILVHILLHSHPSNPWFFYLSLCTCLPLQSISMYVSPGHSLAELNLNKIFIIMTLNFSQTFSSFPLSHSICSAAASLQCLCMLVWVKDLRIQDYLFT